METTLNERSYNDDELLEIKLPLHLPYVTGYDEYERVSGHMIANGNYYNYVKRKIVSDTLYLYCIPNEHANILLDAKNEYGKQVNDLPVSQQESDIPFKKGGTAFQYQEKVPVYQIVAIGMLFKKQYRTISSPLSFLPVAGPYQPPEVVV